MCLSFSYLHVLSIVPRPIPRTYIPPYCHATYYLCFTCYLHFLHVSSIVPRPYLRSYILPYCHTVILLCTLYLLTRTSNPLLFLRTYCHATMCYNAISTYVVTQSFTFTCYLRVLAYLAYVLTCLIYCSPAYPCPYTRTYCHTVI
jgi:hypothetical protein